jgi:peroxiredoxin
MRSKKVFPYLLLAIGLILISIATLVLILQRQAAIRTLPMESGIGCVQPAPVDFPAPSISLTDLSLSDVHLDDYLGDVVLLNTWATWCPPCLAEMPDLQAYYDKYREQGFTLIGVNIGETRGQVLEFGLEQQLSFPLWLDPDEVSMRVLDSMSLPYSVLIDRDGTVRYAWSGATCLDALESVVTPLLVQ